jgi:chaperonin GroES
MATTLKPLNDRLVVERIENDVEKTAGGIIIPDTAKEKPTQGRVVAVGPGRRIEGKVHPLDVKVGDTVLFGKWGGTDVKVDGKELVILKEDDVYGVIVK